MIGLEVLQTSFIYLWEGYNVVETWCHGCLSSLGHYSSHEQFWGVYTLEQEVATFNLKRYCIVVNTTYGSRGGIANSFYIRIGRYELIHWLVTWLFTEP